MNKGVNGTVIVSFGSFMRSASIPPDIVQNFMDAFRQFADYHFVFKVDADTVAAEIAPNVDLVSWLPQSDLLGELVLYLCQLLCRSSQCSRIHHTGRH